MANISQIKLPNGDTHNFIDTTSGYTKNTGTITSIKTTAGTHSTINITSGAVTFNVPTKTSHLTNDSGFKTTDTNTTYTLSGALSSHKFTSTLTAGGSGSGTSTSEITFAAGTGITLTDNATNKKITIAASYNGTVTSVAASGSGGITISGSPITSSGTITIGLNLSTAINGLGEGTSPANINDYAVVQYAGGGTTTTTYHRRKLSNLIVGKAVADQNGLRIDTGYLKLTGGSVTGPTTFGDTVSIDDLNAGQLVVSGSASFANNLQANTINGVAVGNSPKFTDTVTTATTTGSGNAVTAITASNGALTVTKGTTFLTSHNTYTVSTTGTGNAVTAVSLSGTTFTVTKGATYSNNAGTITSVKTTAGAHTAINTTSGAVTFNVPTTAAHVGALASDGTAVAASTLAHKTLNDTTIDNTAGTFAFSGSGEPWSGTDWVGFQVGDSADKFQFTRTGTAPMFRYNDSGGTNSSNWSDWSTLYSTSNKPTAADIGIKFGYSTSGNNRAVLQDSSGNLYVTQKDTDTTVSTLTLAEDTGTSAITLAHGGKYKLTAGTKTVIFTMPASGNTDHRKSFYGTCSTAAATAAKVVSLSSATGWELVAGTVVGVKFTNTNTANNPTLNINSTGAKSIWANNAALTTSNLWYAGEAARVHYYMYDGTYWVFMGHSYDWNSNTTYSAGTGLSLSSTTFSVKTGYTTSGNNRAVQADSSGNLYVTQKDTTYSSMTAAEITAGNGTTARLITPANLKTAIETWSERDIIQAAGTGTTSLAAGTITQVPLTTTLISRDTYDCFTLASNRITINKAGIYRITGSVYINPTTATQLGVYIRMGTGTFANATEIASSLLSGASGAINVTKTIKISSTQYIYLGARSYGYAGSVANTNYATYLEIEYLGN